MLFRIWLKNMYRWLNSTREEAHIAESVAKSMGIDTDKLATESADRRWEYRTKTLLLSPKTTTAEIMCDGYSLLILPFTLLKNVGILLYELFHIALEAFLSPFARNSRRLDIARDNMYQGFRKAKFRKSQIISKLFLPIMVLYLLGCKYAQLFILKKDGTPKEVIKLPLLTELIIVIAKPAWKMRSELSEYFMEEQFGMKI